MSPSTRGNPNAVKPNNSAASSSSSASAASGMSGEGASTIRSTSPNKLPNGRLRLGGRVRDEAAESGGGPSANNNEPGTVDWVSEGERPEAVIFLHGFNSPVSDALKRVAQLWYTQ